MNINIKKILTNPRFYLGIASLQAIVAVVGSLFLSNVIGFEPCILCWWQRIFMYPLAFILSVAFFTRDRGFLKYVFPLLFVGTAFSLYHNTIYYVSIYQRLHPTSVVTTCSLTGPSCTAVYIEWFGFITIPFLALVAFIVIWVSLGLYRKFSK